MALAIEIIYEVEDQAGKRATHTAYAATGFTLAQYTEAIRSLAQLVNAAINGVLVGAEFCVAVDISAVTGNVIGALSDVEEIGAFQFGTAENRRVNLNLPGIADDFSAAGSDDLDQGNGVVAAIISMMEDGITVTGGTIQPSDVDEADIVSTIYAREEVRNSGSRG